MRSAAVMAGGGGAGVDEAVWPPWGDGSCEVDVMSPTATHVEHDRDACSNLQKRSKQLEYLDLIALNKLFNNLNSLPSATYTQQLVQSHKLQK